jgi:PAS domain S-box-containing protein
MSDIKLGELPVTLLWKRSGGFKTQSSLVASWAGFCGALISIFLAILLSSLENLTVRAQKIAGEKNYELIERERLWRTLTDSSPVGIYLSDEKAIVYYMNGTLLRLLGRTLPEVLKAGWSSFLHPEDKERVQQNWQGFKAAPIGTFHGSFRFICDTRVVYVISEAVALRNVQGQVTGYLGTIQDMTELQLKQMALVASSRMSSLGEMASGMAHEINNPLAIISGKALHLELLLKQQPLNIERVHSHIQAINSNVERIVKIIRGLRSLARDVPDDPIREVCVRDIIQDTLVLSRSRFKHHEVMLLVPSNIDETLTCFARPEQIVQVLLNLLNNAFDAVCGLDEKWVRIEIEILDKKLQFSVTDSGKGLRQELLDKIFVPFFTTKEVGRGTGLGLSISRGIIEKHDGRLYIDEQSTNTKFIVELNA